MSTEEQLRRVVRQIRTELEWAARTGIVIEAPKVSEAAPRLAPETPSQPPMPATPSTPPTPSVEPRSVAPAPAAASPPAGPAPSAALATPADASPAAPAPNPNPPAPPPVQVPPSVAPQAPSPSPPPAAAPRTAEGPSTPAVASTPPSRLPVLATELAACASLEDVRAVLGDCTRCKLHRQGRKQIVYGVGSPNAEIMFVGEGPGAEEDRRGEPFVGAAGELLTSIIENGMGIQRPEVYIANVVKCRPPQNRDPEPDEVAACEPFLAAQIRVIKPKVLVTLGKHAAHTLLGVQTPITRLRGKWGEYQGTPLMPTYHPAYLLRNPAEKRAVWEDVKEVLRFLGRPVPGRGNK